MKNIFLFVLVTMIAASSFASESGSSGRGGGDLCEDRIQQIADDIQSWIHAGGSQALKLPQSVSVQNYDKNMLTAIASLKAKCVKPGDDGYPVQIGKTAKVCRFDKTNSYAVITCDYNAFLDRSRLDESSQYVLIHHEIAGIAGLENPKAEASTYALSNQISGYLVDQVVKKLAVKSIATAKTSTPCTQPVPTVAGLFTVIANANAGVSEIRAYLENAPVSMGARNEMCLTPVQAAIKAKKLDVYKYLYARSGSSDVNTPDQRGITLFNSALIDGDMRMIDFVRSQGGRITGGTELMWVASGNTPEIVRAILNEKHESLEARDYSGRTALMYAAGSGSVAVIKYLISLGAEINAHDLTQAGVPRPQTLTGKTALFYAIMANTDAAVKALLDAGAEINAVEGDVGQTPLHFAVGYKRLNLIRLLISAGADVNSRDHNGQTALYDVTCSSGGIDGPETQIALMLLSAGADPNITNNDGWSVLMNIAYGPNPPLNLLRATLNAGARKDLQVRGQTAYELAKERHQSSVVLQLLKP